MIDVDKAVIARLKKNGKTVEVLVDCEAARAFRRDRRLDLREVLAYEKIFADSKKGTIASQRDLQQLFNTDDVIKIAEIIITQGEIQLTAAIRERLREQMKKRIITYIHNHTIDPRTNYLHPVQRIELALAQVRIKIDEHKDEKTQVEEIVRKLQPVLPVKMIEEKARNDTKENEHKR